MAAVYISILKLIKAHIIFNSRTVTPVVVSYS